MALTPFNDNFQVNAPKALDNKYGKFVAGVWQPFANITEAQTAINPAYRSKGLTQLILKNGIPTEYWYRDGITNGDLIEKFQIVTDYSNTVAINGTGNTASPLIADVRISSFPNNSILAFGDGVYSPSTIRNGVISGGYVTWDSGYTYEITSSFYYIDGVPYTSPSYTVLGSNAITLDPADSTFNRIDVFYVDTTSTVKVLKGTASSTPLKPDLADDQLELSFVLVEAGTTEPTLSSEQVYFENTGEPDEWTGSVPVGAARINLGSTSSPILNSVSIEATNAEYFDRIEFVNDTTFVLNDNFVYLTFKYRTQDLINYQYKRVVLYFRAGNTPVGNGVYLGNGSFGYNATSLNTQTITIPVTAFGVPNIIPIDTLVIEAQSFFPSMTNSFKIDDIKLQNTAATPIPYAIDTFIALTDTPNTYSGQSGKIPIVNGTEDGLEFVAQSNDWKVLGNSGLSAATNFFGTTDNVPLRFRINNEKAGRIDGATNPNTGIGYNVFNALTSGLINNAFGGYALSALTTGNQNNAFGYGALNLTTTGSWNSAFGDQTLVQNITGQQNTAVGFKALNANTNSYNTAIGTNSLEFSTSGTLNTALGGYASRTNTTGQQNTALGYSALRLNSTGNNNTAVGVRAGYNTVGSGNVFLGYSAGDNETGSNKLYIANTNTSTPLIGGDFTAARVDVNGVIKITGGTPGIGKVLTAIDTAGNAVWQTPSGGGATTFLTLTDTPSVYTGQAGKILAVNAGATGVEFIDAPSGGTIYTSDNGITKTGNNFQLGGSLLANTTILTGENSLIINTSSNGIIPLQVNSTTSHAIQAGSVDGNGVNAFATGFGVGVVGQGESNSGVSASSRDGAAIDGQIFPSDGSSEIPILRLYRGTTGTPTNGIGGSIQFQFKDSINSISNSGRFGYINMDITNTAQSSKFFLDVYNAGTRQTVFELLNTGQSRFNKYGEGTFTGTPAYSLAVDSSGNVIETALGGGGGGSYTFNNGLTEAGGIAKLGGTLLNNTIINTDVNSLTIESANTGITPLIVNSVGADSISATSTNQAAVRGNSTSGPSIAGSSTSGIGGLFSSSSSIAIDASTNNFTGIPSAQFSTGSGNGNNNTVLPNIIIRRLANGTPADGIGSSIVFDTRTVESNDNSTTLISKWTTASHATRTSEFSITGFNNTIESTLFTLAGTGQVKLNKYGINSFGGTPAYALAVDSSGNVIETALGGGGGAEVDPFAWKITGNTGINEATNFIGNTDFKSLFFKINSWPSGGINLSRESTSFGYKTYSSLTTGNLNAAFGNYSLEDLTTGSGNNAFGYATLRNITTSDNNSAFGLASLANLTTGEENTVIGMNAGGNLITGSYNVMAGAYANVIGPDTDQGAGFKGVAVGYYSIAKDYGISIGAEAHTEAKNVIAIGYLAGAGLNGNTNANNDIQEDLIVEGTFANTNINIGHRSSSLAFSNSIALGAYAENSAANQLMIGSTYRPINEVVIKGTTTEYIDNADAVSNGLAIGTIYRTGDLLKIVH